MNRIYKSIALIGAIIMLFAMGASDNGYSNFAVVWYAGLIGLLMVVVGLKGSKIMQ